MLTIHVVSMGNKMPDWVQQGYHHYAKRITGKCAINLIEVAAVRRGKNPDLNKIAQLETEQFVRAIPSATRIIAFQREGKPQSTLDIARRMEDWMRNGEQISLLIGGVENLPPQVLQMADEVWSLSALTFAHPLARVIVAEQIYRGYSLLEGLPYHR